MIDITINMIMNTIGNAPLDFKILITQLEVSEICQEIM